MAAAPFEASALPPLNPNHPTHSMPAPITVSGMLCGAMAVCGNPRRSLNTNAATSAATPAFTCTTMPPAKSSTPSFASQPPPHTQWQMGRYTRSNQAPVNHSTALNRIRSAKPPMTSAGVMIAKVSWNIANAGSGTVPLSESRPTPLNHTLLMEPIKACALPPSPNASP